MKGSFPDENFAREFLELFSIGLYILNEDGTRKLDETVTQLSLSTTRS